jgi:hypothetical protein
VGVDLFVEEHLISTTDDAPRKGFGGRRVPSWTGLTCFRPASQPGWPVGCT